MSSRGSPSGEVHPKGIYLLRLVFGGIVGQIVVGKNRIGFVVVDKFGIVRHLGIRKLKGGGRVGISRRIRARNLVLRVVEHTCYPLLVVLVGVHFGEFTLSSLDVLQRFSFFFQMGLTLILATLDGLDVGLLGDVIDEDDCDDDGLKYIYSGGKV
uniref:Uncharacterized protein n=1 Tax=Tanacetum cinerariifolium TaxID=118510 RepID=A0A699HM24_TANCI|nr:hypothetical protein [Tanacetum cinerariifolium]